MERIHVSVRARPLSTEDAKTSPWRISNNSIFIPNQPSRFDFDRIFGEHCKTEDVYRARTRDLVAAAVRGFNGTVFAYGQTSSGKTHTMRGSDSEPGVIPLAVHELFRIIQQETDREFLLRMSYMEIYNEEINDLLAPEHRKLQIHESIERGIYVAGLRENIVASADQVLKFMEFGESHRHIGETNMNVYSSRSHTIFRMIIESRDKTDDAEAGISCDAVRVSVLNLVDLAGSERAAKTGAEGVRLKEGSHINKSLMTLGTVIKKLSEGVESQGGHVPYRDSKLTRILQPALGGNANTAIICNITLAQIHADETKSSLQFASRALRVTNCAHVNEILTDAALLKRQKKEIEELRAKLQGSHSGDLEGEILDLRNTLLKSELERERIALELEEEKRAQVERERMLQEQAKKIENLSSMVLCANREETSDVFKKAKRRDTWCPGKLAKENLKELSSEIKEKISDVKPTKKDRKRSPLLPFSELVEEASDLHKDSKRTVVDDCTLPDPRALLHVTSRKKVAPRKRSLPMESNDLAEMQEEYEKLLQKYETHRIMSDVQIDCLMRKLAETDIVEKGKEYNVQSTTGTSDPDGNSCLGDTDAILVIKQLQEKIAVLEMEKSSSQQNLDCMFNLATEQTLSAKEKYEKLYEELQLVREEATQAHETLISSQSRTEEYDRLIAVTNVAMEIELEFENSRHLNGSLSSVVDEHVHFISVISSLLRDLRTSTIQNSLEIKSIIRSHEMVKSELRNKIQDLEDEKRDLSGEASELRLNIEELSLKVQNCTNALAELNEENNLEKSEFLCQIQMLEREISSLSSCTLAKEKESIRKDLEKTKLKLKDTESKLKNTVQEKIKLEGEKSCAEREVKRLLDQKVLLEKRDMSKRETNVFDRKRVKGSIADAAMQDEYKKLEELAYEMEATIASLEEQLEMTNNEKDEAVSRAEILTFDLQNLSDEFDKSHSELNTLNEEVLTLRTTLEESKFYREEMETTVKTLSEENDDLSMQLTEALLTMEEEKAIWSSKEKASLEVIEGNDKQHNAEITFLSDQLSKARYDLDTCRNNCKELEELLTRSKEDANSQNLESNEQRACDELSKRSPEITNIERGSNYKMLVEQIETLQFDLSALRKERVHLLGEVQKLEARLSVSTDNSQVEQLKLELKEQSDKLANLEVRTRIDQVSNGKEKAKLRMRLKGSQTKLDNYRVRYQELVNEMDLMNRKFEEASRNLKTQLGTYGAKVLHLTRQLAIFRAN